MQATSRQRREDSQMLSRSSLWKWFCLCLVASALQAAEPAATPPQPEVAPQKVLVTISPETTRITAPLRRNGYPDYVESINQRASQGVTPESNASVLFWQATGPAPLDADLRERFWKKLGIAPLPDTGNYWVPLKEFVNEHSELVVVPQHLTGQARDDAQLDIAFEQGRTARTRPWKPDDFPVIAAWLNENEIPLRLAIEGASRPQRYEPCITTEPETVLLSATNTGALLIRDFTYALLCRAMQSVEKNDYASAERDLIACHRMAHLLGRSPWTIDVLVGTAVHNLAFDTEQAWLQSESMTSEQLGKLQAKRQPTLSIPDGAQNYDICERWFACDALCYGAASGKPFPSDLLNGPTKNKMLSGLQAIAAVKIDYDIILRHINNRYDRCVATLREPDRAKRNADAEAFDQDLDKVAEETKARLFKPVLLGSTAEVSEWVANMYVMGFVTEIHPVIKTQDRFRMRNDVMNLGIALAKYKQEHNEFPGTLEQLVPKYVGQIPRDLYTGNALIYRTDGQGYMLYSLGENLQDDAGKTYADANDVLWQKNESVDWDDLSLRVPARWQHPKEGAAATDP